MFPVLAGGHAGAFLKFPVKKRNRVKAALIRNIVHIEFALLE
jgi:hypothetical protein